MKEKNKDLVLSIPRGYGEDFIEKANNISTDDLKLLNEFLRQAIHARMSCLISKNLPDGKGDQTLVCDFPLDTPENGGMSGLEQPWVESLIQHQGGEITIAFEVGKVGFEYMKTEDLLYILEQF